MRCAAGLGAGLLLLAATGCAPSAADPNRIENAPLEKNIIKIVPMYGMNPFGTVGGGSKINGFVIGALYLMGPDGKGVFGDGTIHVFLYEVDRTRGKKVSERRLVREWLFDTEKAKPYRSRKRYLGGYGYQLHCAWGDIDLGGKDVEIEVHFERTDGRVITSLPKAYTVPPS